MKYRIMRKSCRYKINWVGLRKLKERVLPLDKKEIIVQSAIHLFQHKGIEQTTVSDIVKQSRIAQGTFYLYFPSKLSLMPAIAEEMVKVLVKRMREKISESMTIDEQMENIIESIFSINEEYSEVLAMIYSGLASTEHLKEWETVYAPCYELISNLLEEAIGMGTIQSSIQPHRTAKLIIGLVESAAEQVYLYNHSDEKEIENQKEAVTQFLFDSLHIKK